MQVGDEVRAVISVAANGRSELDLNARFARRKYPEAAARRQVLGPPVGNSGGGRRMALNRSRRQIEPLPVSR